MKLFVAHMGIRIMASACSSPTADTEIVCVTGNWGLLGYWVVRMLLDQGYFVRSTVPLAAEEVTQLRSLSREQDRLQLLKADLLDYGRLSELFQDCVGVFYVPAPNYDLNGARDYPVETIDNEVRKVLNVVEACANASAVKKLVVTSCLSSILWNKQYYIKEVVLDERNWSDLDFCRKEKMWSALSKTMAEKAAWALARDRGLRLVVMNPAIVVEPKSCSDKSSSNLSCFTALDQSGIFAYVHVDDLAASHIMAFEAEGAAGRYICFERLLSRADIVDAARELYPNYPVAKKLESFTPCVLSNEKVKNLGLNFAHSSGGAVLMAR